MSREILIVQTGTANIASVLAGLRRAGARPELTGDPERVARAERIVLPGVGALAAAKKQLVRDGLDEALATRVGAGRPTLAICLGLQLLCTRSAESPDTPGLGVLAGDVVRLPATVSVPQMGWNLVTPHRKCRYLKSGYAYFANSYCLTSAPEPWRPAWSDHGGPFIAAVEQGDVVACQFHPELSGPWGQDLLTRWLAGDPTGGAPC